MAVDPKVPPHPYGAPAEEAIRLYGPRELVEEIEQLEAEGYQVSPIGILKRVRSQGFDAAKKDRLQKLDRELDAWFHGELAAGRLIMSGVVVRRDEEGSVLPSDPGAARTDVSADQFAINQIGCRAAQVRAYLRDSGPDLVPVRSWEIHDARVRRAAERDSEQPLEAGARARHASASPAADNDVPYRDETAEAVSGKGPLTGYRRKKAPPLDEEKCLAWLKAQLEADLGPREGPGPVRGRPRSKDDLFTEAGQQTDFRLPPKAVFLKLWKEAAKLYPGASRRGPKTRVKNSEG